jgi:hypothetical protein
MAMCLRIAERDRGVISNEVVSANAAGAEGKKHNQIRLWLEKVKQYTFMNE